MTFVASWPKHAVAETSVELGGAAIRAAAQRAVMWWPEEPELEPGDSYARRSHTVTGAEPDDPGAQTEP